MNRIKNILIPTVIFSLCIVLIGIMHIDSEKREKRALDYLNRQVETIDETIKNYKDGLMTDEEFDIAITRIESEMRNDIANDVFSFDATYDYSMEVLRYCAILPTGNQEEIGEQFFKVYIYYYDTK